MSSDHVSLLSPNFCQSSQTQGNILSSIHLHDIQRIFRKYLTKILFCRHKHIYIIRLYIKLLIMFQFITDL